MIWFDSDVDMREGEQGTEELETLFIPPDSRKSREVTLCYGVRRGLKQDVEKTRTHLFNTDLLHIH